MTNARKATLLLAAFALSGCAVNDEERTADLGPGDPRCGGKLVYWGGCGDGCAAPCLCLGLGVQTTPEPRVCVHPCAYPWDCRDDERCGVLSHSGNDQAVCMPESLAMTGGPGVSGSIDCDLNTALGGYGCKGKLLVQLQVVGLTGPVSGCVEFEALQRICPGACTHPDGGPGRDAGGLDGRCTGGPDAGPGEVGPDARAATTCCPVGPVVPWGTCTFLGGPKKAPGGCPALCGHGSHGKGKIVPGELGCDRWQPL